MTRKIQVTKNYRLFATSQENRPTNVKKHGKLVESMKLYGFLSCFPIACHRDKDGNLIVKDGQHRLAIAEMLGLPVYWIEEKVDFEVSLISGAAVAWNLRDHAMKHATHGKTAYQVGLDFADRHHLPIGTAFSLLAGYTGFSATQAAFIDGSFKIKDQPWADAVAGVYGPVTKMAPLLKSARFIEACMMACRVPSFDGGRLIHNAERCREKLVPYSTKDAYLDMLDEIYNFGRNTKNRVALKFEAVKAMRSRNPGVPKTQKSAA